mmetsp:Transcript_128455/g.363557  ORF Transcript_128455/g.363557 Transcript_128455/m.363557 type:complete len:314 (-) Transcript_128455:1310-2251(-)
MKLTRPATASRWPVCDFAVVMARDVSRLLKQARTEPHSIGSPSAVPVPWFSRTQTPVGGSDSSLRQLRMHCCWDGPFGAVRLALRPSWLMKLETWHPSRSWMASMLSLRCRKTPPVPSPRCIPLALLSAKSVRPAGPIMPAWLRPMKGKGCRSHVWPRARPSVASSLTSCCRSRAWMMFAATSPEEQAVSRSDEKPTRPNAYISRLHVPPMLLFPLRNACGAACMPQKVSHSTAHSAMAQCTRAPRVDSREGKPPSLSNSNVVSSITRWGGGIQAAVSSAMPKNRLSNSIHSRVSRKPACLAYALPKAPGWSE